MATIKKFEDLEIWQLARDYSNEIYKISRYAEFSRDYRLVDQITKSSGSVMDNIAEGFGRGGNKEFSNFLSISAGSVNESKSQLYRVLDQKYIDESEFEALYNKADIISNKIGNLIQYLKSSPHRGVKFK